MDFRYESSSFILYHEIFCHLAWTLGEMLDKLKLSDIQNISFLNLVMTHEYFFIKNMINCARGYVNFTLIVTLKYYEYMLYRTMKNYQAFFQDTRQCFV